MSSEWTNHTVGDVFDLINGYAFKSSDFVEDGVPVIKIKNVKAGEFSEHQFSYVPADFLQVRSDKLVKYGDLLISMSGNRHDGSPSTWVGKVAQFRKKGNYFLNQRVGVLRVKPELLGKIHPRFAAYVLSADSYQKLFIAVATSSGGQANLSPSQILSAPYRYPTYPQQTTIAQILGNLDDKIELNRKMNQTLEEMAQAIFKSWFIDFDGVPEEDLVDSELGRIPRGWTSGTLLDVAQLNPESWTTRQHPDSLKYLDLANVKWGSVESVTEHVWNDAPSRARRVLRKGDTIVGTVRPGNGSYTLVMMDGFTGSTGFAVLRPDLTSFRCFTYLAATSKANLDRLTHLADGGAYPAVRPTVVGETLVPIPPLEIAKRFEELVGPLKDKYAANEVESQTLSALRDTLLPKLISGEIRVPAAEKIVEEHA